jgi:alkyl sulfatase BDS1-like metallo-beta-lactamase superfamily hydrolase
VSENVFAGDAMIRRAMYMVAGVLPRGHEAGETLGTGLGVASADDTPTLITPTDVITRTGEKMQIDGLEFEFQLVPGSEE